MPCRGPCWAFCPVFGAEYKAAAWRNKDDVGRARGRRTAGRGVGLVLELEEFAARLAPGARLIGMDVGTKTIGLALSDVTRTIASGLLTLPRGKFAADAARLAALVKEHGVGGFVIGLPVHLNGSEGPRAQATRAFARNLSRAVPLPILFWDERLTTAAAERALLEADTSRKRRGEVIDKVAATLILQGALDRLKRLQS
jgi:putative holliday junction resolvase